MKHRKIGLHYDSGEVFFFSLCINYITHILDNERQHRKIGKVMKQSLEEALCGPSLVADTEGVKLDEGHLYCLNQRERNISLPSVIFKNNSKYQSAHFQSSSHFRYGKVF